MVKIIKVILFCLIIFFIIPSVLAYEEKRGVIYSKTGNGLNLRTEPSVSSDVIISLPDDSNLTIIGEASAGNGCDDIWYQIKYNELNAYACSSYIVIIEGNDGSISEEFPDDYKLLLAELQKIYPNAIFKPISATNSIGIQQETGKLLMDFDTALYNQYYTQNKSLIWDSDGSRNGWKNLESYNYDTNSFFNSYSGGGINWYSASEDIIAYYLDPRNFITEESIFMFESLGYDASVHTVEGVANILKGTYMANENPDNGDKTFAEVIMEAGKKYNVSPYFLASRIRLEVGTGRSDLVKGTYASYPQFNGYYNYYNIGAGGDNVVYNGLSFAYDSGWNSEVTAIIEGAAWIKANYVQSGTSTNYTQKWDVFCEGRSSCFSKQYMQNIQAPETEAITAYNAYKQMMGPSFYEIPYIFYIPVFDNMEESNSIPSKENPISYLNSLIVDGTLLPNFHGLTYDYEIVVPFNTTSINISAIPTVSNSTIVGTGDIEIKNEEEVFKIVVTAANLNTTTYTIKVTKLKAGENLLTFEETIAKLTNIKIMDNYMSGITSIDVLKEKFSTANPNALVIVRDKEENIVNSGNIKTGDEVSITVNGVVYVYTYVLYGDLNGDASIDIVDLLLVQKHLLNATNLTNEYLKASDINKDGLVDIVDLLLVQKHLLGSAYINQ